jgi:hypothetical protein
MVAKRRTAPPTAEQIERVNRQPGVIGHPAERGVTPESAEAQPEQSLHPEHRRYPSGLLDVQHPPGPHDRPERKR